MADYKKYDPRVDALVMENRTLWSDDIGELSDEDRRWLAAAVHRSSEAASHVEYDRSHTGFTRTITVTLADIERLYDERVAVGA